MFEQLLWSIRQKDLENCKRVLVYWHNTDQHDEINRSGMRGLPPLYVALTRKPVDPEIVEYLLQYGADPNLKISREEIHIRDKSKRRARAFCGWTAAHLCARFVTQEEIFHVLKRYFTDFKEGDAAGWLPLRVAKNDRNKIAQKFLKSILPPLPAPMLDCCQRSTSVLQPWYPPELAQPIAEFGTKAESEEETDLGETCSFCEISQEIPPGFTLRASPEDFTLPYSSIVRFGLMTSLGLFTFYYTCL